MEKHKIKSYFKFTDHSQKRVSLKNVQKAVGKSAIHGGKLAAGQRKSRRPLSYRHPIVLILSSQKAKGVFSLSGIGTKNKIQRTLRGQSHKFRIRIESFANSGSTLQIRLRARQREDFQNFLRSFSAMVARQVTGARKGKPFGRFWDHLALTYIAKPLRAAQAKLFSLQLRIACGLTSKSEIWVGADP